MSGNRQMSWCWFGLAAIIASSVALHLAEYLSSQASEGGAAQHLAEDKIKAEIQRQGLLNYVAALAARNGSLEAQVKKLEKKLSNLDGINALIAGDKGTITLGDVQICFGRLALVPGDNKTARAGNDKFNAPFKRQPNVTFSFPTKHTDGHANAFGNYMHTITNDSIELVIYPVDLSGMTFFPPNADVASEVYATYIAIGEKK